jgi:hypothetical protein
MNSAQRALLKWYDDEDERIYKQRRRMVKDLNLKIVWKKHGSLYFLWLSHVWKGDQNQ